MAGGAGIDRRFERRLAALVNARAPGLLAGGKRGLERESLRVTPGGALAQTPHPRALGSPLTHASITTDYSESLLELVTPPFNSNAALLAFLDDLLAFVHARLGDELLWAESMPCEIAGDAAVPIADYGRSHQGRYKQVYRRGLLTRYGGMMQAIAGVHFNYSFAPQFWPLWAEVEQRSQPDQSFITGSYFGLLRNFRRYGWMVLWLFGASPAMCASFLRGPRSASLRELGSDALLAPTGTSLRMSDLGYRNRSQSALVISSNGLHDYLRDLLAAVRTPYAPFAQLGVVVAGEYRQLNGNRLQIENEYYSPIRPKRVPQEGENTCQALARGGVEYVEVRVLDLNPFEPAGVSLPQLCLLEALLLLLLLRDSPPLEADEQEALERNFAAVAGAGRDLGLTLLCDGRLATLRVWAGELLDQLQGCCELLDAAVGGDAYRQALADARAALADPARLPSARVQSAVQECGGFTAHALRQARANANYYRRRGAGGADAALEQSARESLLEQQRLERNSTGEFADYIAGRLQKYHTIQF